MDFYTAALLQGLGYAAMGLGIFITLRIFNIPDITTDGSYTLGGAIAAVLLMSGVNPLFTLIAAMAGGALAGISTGLLHVKMKVNPLLAGILVMTGLYSVNLSIMGRSNIPLIDVNTLFSIIPCESSSAQLWTGLILIIGIITILLVALLKTDFGIAMRATGNGERMVRAMGVNTGTMKITGLAIANALTALSGYLLVQHQGFADINMGIGIVISGLAAVMIGEALAGLFRSRGILFQVLMVIIGSISFRMILALALSMGLNPNYLKLITALIVIVVLGLTRFRKVTT